MEKEKETKQVQENIGFIASIHKQIDEYKQRLEENKNYCKKLQENISLIFN